MHAMTKLFVVAGLVFATACGGKADGVISEFESFKSKMCDCKDKSCAEGVKGEMKEWEKKMKEEGMKKKDLTDDQKKRVKEIDKELDSCADKLLK